MPRKKFKALYYIYKITCKINGKFYVGMHKQTSEIDKYMGSGKRLGYSINKYGRENHIKEILEYLPDWESLVAREIELVNETMINDPLCMNLKLGGRGGNTGANGTYLGGDKCKKCTEYWNIPINKAKQRKNCSEISNRLWADKDFREKMLESSSRAFLGKSHSEETKDIMRKKAQERIGEKNSQFGTCWITNGLENKKIKKNEVDKFINEGWKLGRIVL